MSWFFETENDVRERKIVSYAGQVCAHLRNIMSRLDQDGSLNYSNSSFVLGEMQSMISVKEQMESEITQLSQSKLGKLCLPWVDGRNIPFHLWAGSYQMIALELQNMINKL